MSLIDLRSDTVTTPTDEMRRAMATAEVGDDVFREDPTVNRLEEKAAGMLGKEAGIFLTSGTMGNLIGVLVQAGRGDEVMLEAESHIFHNEAAGLAVVGSIQARPIITERGVIAAEQIEGDVRPSDDVHQPRSAAVCFESSHNRHGGTVWPLAALHQARAVALTHGLGVHLDGARLFNAAVALGVSAKDLAECVDTVTFCLSKGLCCPAGSVLAGSEDQIRAARRWRKLLGGGMRQAGVLAAAGLVALDGMVERLAEDHLTARILAEGLSEMPGVSLDLDRVQTNIIRLRLEGRAVALVEECRKRGLLLLAAGPRAVRLVTHHGISEQEAKEALSRMGGALDSLKL